MEPMFKLIGKFILNAAALWVAAHFFPQISYGGDIKALAGLSAGLALINVLF
jgi:hypothetical protein